MSTQETFRVWVRQVGGIAPAGDTLCCSPGHISNLYHGRRRPSAALAARIEAAARIPMRQWYEPLPGDTNP